MPQLAQLPEIFWSQLFWLVVVFGITFVVIGLGMVPRIQSTVDLREGKIADDLQRAQAARADADETEQAWRDRMDAARAEAARIASEAKQASARETEVKVKATAEALGAKLDASKRKLRERMEAASAEIETVSVELAQELVSRLTGIAVDSPAAAAAVKAEMHG